jgi:D-aminopeptidase
MVAWLLAQPGMEDVRSINPVVGETNDGLLSDIRARPIRPEHVTKALESATSGPVDEGCVGAGAGTVAFGWKGGIGTASRRLPQNLGGYTIGILVQTNFGGVLSIDGVPVGKELGQYYLKNSLSIAVGSLMPSSEIPHSAFRTPQSPDGSIIIVIATDAPLDHRQLERLAARSMSGLARTGSSMSNGSGDYAIAFSTANRIDGSKSVRTIKVVGNNAMSPLFQDVIEATEESIINSLFKATTVTGNGRTVEALPLEKVCEIMKKYGRIEK